MAIAYRARNHQLTRAGFELIRPRRHLSVLRGVLAGIVVAVSGVGGYFWLAPEAESVRELAAMRHEKRQLAKDLEQSRLDARMASARARELERQVDTLNHSLRELQDELAFFRKAQEGKR